MCNTGSQEMSPSQTPNLTGRAMPSLYLPSTAGDSIDLSALGNPLAVLYLYPMTARPGVPLPEGWDLIPGARRCTPEACSFRDRYAELRALGVDLYGLSGQSSEYQREAVDRLRLPFPLLSDETLALAEELSLPTFTAGGMRLFTRLTMLIAAGTIERVFYPVPSPADHAAEAFTWPAVAGIAGTALNKEVEANATRRLVWGRRPAGPCWGCSVGGAGHVVNRQHRGASLGHCSQSMQW